MQPLSLLLICRMDALLEITTDELQVHDGEDWVPNTPDFGDSEDFNTWWDNHVAYLTSHGIQVPDIEAFVVEDTH
jgi:hypothetical protein